MPPQEREVGRLVRADEIANVLLSGRFCRSPRALSKSLEDAIETTISQGNPFRLLMLWGKGRKQHVDRAEAETCELLLRYRERLTRIWPRAFTIRVLFADTHARINGYPAQEVDRYFQETRQLLENVTRDFGLLSDLWAEVGISEDVVSRRAMHIEAHWRDLDDHLRLTERAARYSLRSDPEECARTYAATRLLENEALDQMYGGWIYVTSDSHEMAPLLPSLPVIHLYSRARGYCEKPWNTRLEAKGR